MYEVAIIGAGPAGIEAAKSTLFYKLKSILIEKSYGHFGGVCLNEGCIPAKYYLNASSYNLELEVLYQKKNHIIDSIKEDALSYLQKKGIEIIWGKAQLYNEHKIKIEEKIIEAKNIIVAVGSNPFELIKVDRKRVFFAEDIFALTNIPQKILIVGAGAVGLEIACLLHNLKRDVLVIEKEERILPTFDRFLSNRLRIILERKGIKIRLKENITNYNIDDFDMVLLATGRVPNINDLGADKIGISMNGEWINVDMYLKTKISNIYAAGDITGNKLLACVAEAEGKVAVDNIVGNQRKLDLVGLPECVFTYPQLSSVGILEEEAEKRNIKYNIIKSNFLKFSSSYVYSDTDGFIEILFDENENILGAGIISLKASELISILSLAIRSSLKIGQLKKATFIHPTLSEIISKSLRM